MARTPQDMLRLTVAVVGPGHVVAALQAPNQHYADRPATGVQPTAAYNWGVQQHWQDAVCVHHDIVTSALGRLRNRFELPATRCVLLGFSQPVGLNYRFAATYPGEVGGIVGICGGVPRDWEEDKYQTVTAPILHISREADEFYPKAVAAEFPSRLRRHATDVEFHMLPGAHRFPSQAGPVIRAWLARVSGQNRNSDENRSEL